ncbi:MAG: chemotaxis protein CheA [Cyanobacteriota bacterium]|nr:chemotaxis protein CheA [Cyanobacteriota bacterium]
MALLDQHTDQLLQDIALELAFVSSGGQQSALNLLNALGKLKQSVQEKQGSAQSVAALSRLISWLEAMGESATPWGDSELASLQQHYLALEKSLYSTTESNGAAERSEDGSGEGGSGSEPALLIKVESKDELELLNEFCNEGRDLLNQVEQGVLVLEENPGHRETLNQVFRAFHTFKGGAGFLGLDAIKDLAHILESLLDAARQNTLDINRPVIDLILKGGDTLRQFIDQIEQSIRSGNQHTPIIIPTLELISRVKATLAGEQPAAAPVAFDPDPHSLHPDPDSLNPSPAAGPGELAEERLAEAPHKPDPLSNFVKIDTQKLDALIDLVGELVIAKSMVVEHPLLTQQRKGELPRHLRQLSRISSDLQHNAMSLRMVPIRTTFQKMNRLVRDLASSQGKQVMLALKGEDTELDRNIVEALTEPLLHMMRNSIDHGLEKAEERLRCGKPAQGRIEIEASHQGGGILIRISDDGRGIDPEKVLLKAREKGIVESNFNGSKSEILNLIFQAGFSTAATVTDVSGRGVGMDVVQGSINRLRGRIEVSSEAGQGTTFLIRLPLTLAIIDGMLVGVGDQRFILPTLSIVESFRPTATMLSTVKGQGRVVNLRGNLIPILNLAARLGIQGGVESPEDGIILVINSSGLARGVLVDRLITKQEVVIKALGHSFEQQPLYSGAAIMGDGQVALILDPDALGRPISQAGSPADTGQQSD